MNNYKFLYQLDYIYIVGYDHIDKKTKNITQILVKPSLTTSTKNLEEWINKNQNFLNGKTWYPLMYQLYWSWDNETKEFTNETRF